MADRIRLTPDGRFGNACARRDDTGAFGTYEIDDGYGVATLTDAEALAFARQLPEIKAHEEQVEALMTAADRLLTIAKAVYAESDWTLGQWLEDELTVQELRVALANIEGA